MLRKLICASMVASLLSGCSLMMGGRLNAVVLNNTGKQELNDAHVSYGEFESVGGVLVPGAVAGHGGISHPLPERATVQWRTPDGTLHSKEVAVRSQLPKGFRGEVWFQIDDSSGVTVIGKKPLVLR